ncbi:MAG: NAD(P)-dependent oxidoreductase [Ferruginibacter sp.]
MKKALVIGSEGNIGYPLVKYLKSKGYDIMETDIRSGWRENYLMADINFPVDMLPAFDWKPNVVFMLSAIVSRVTCEQASSLSISTNLGGLNNVIQLTKRVNAKLVYFSTSEVYGPGSETMDEDLTKPTPNNRYGLSKLLGESLVEYEVRHHKLKAVTLRPFMMYDENEDWGDHRSAMIRFAVNLALNKPVEVHTGSARGWLHVSDAVAAIEASAHLDEYAVINIGHNDVISIADLSEMIRKELGAPKDLINYLELPDRMTLIKNPSTKKMNELLKIIPKVGLEEGIRRVCDKVKEKIKNGTLS